MRQSFLDFVQEKNNYIKNKNILTESFNKKSMDSVLSKIESLLSKHIDGLIPLSGYIDSVIDDKKYISKQYIVVDKNDYTKSSAFQFNWLIEENSIDIYSIDFFKDLDVYWTGKGKSDLTIYTLGTSISRCLPIIWNVVNNNDYNLSKADAEKLTSKIFNDTKESLYIVDDKFEYRIIEKLKYNIIHDAFLIESNNDILNFNEDEDDNKEGEVNISVKNGSSIKYSYDKSVDDAEKELSKENKKEPEQVFKEMSKYISLVIKGLQPSLILCGAPGVGKTFRVKKQLKENNYKEGVNMNTIKGKCTTRRLYLALYEMKKKGQITLIDDADSLVGPKADENSINILKAALDSTEDAEGRLVTYGIAGKLLDDDGNEVPKKFYYNGSVIVITNYQAGSLDTALKGRSFMQDIHFSNDDVLSIVKNLMPSIDPEIYSAKAKIKAFNYLNELNESGSEMELSIRTFVLCTKIFEATIGDNTFDDDDAKSMIKEQMKLQYARSRGEKY